MSWFKKEAQVGSVGILAVITLALLGVIGAGMVARTSTETDMAASYRNGVAAQYLAEAGARWAIDQLNADPAFTADPAWMSPIVGTGATTGSFQVAVEQSGGNRIITSIGRVGRSTRMVFFQVSPSVFSSAVFCGPNFKADQNTTITGSVGTNGNAVFAQNSIVTGMVSAHGTVKVGQNSSVPKTEGAPLVNIPTVDIPTGNYSAFPSPTWPLSGGSYYVNGPLNVSQNTTLKANGTSTIYVNGSIKTDQNVTIDGNITLVALNNKDINIGQNMEIKGELVLQAEGNIKLDQNFNKNASNPGSVLIMAEGTINVGQNFGKQSGASKSALFANGKITIDQGATINGFVVSVNGVDLSQNAKITYDDAYVGRFGIPAGGLNIGPWSSYNPN